MRQCTLSPAFILFTSTNTTDASHDYFHRLFLHLLNQLFVSRFGVFGLSFPVLFCSQYPRVPRVTFHILPVSVFLPFILLLYQSPCSLLALGWFRLRSTPVSWSCVLLVPSSFVEFLALVDYCFVAGVLITCLLLLWTFPLPAFCYLLWLSYMVINKNSSVFGSYFSKPWQFGL